MNQWKSSSASKRTRNWRPFPRFSRRFHRLRCRANTQACASTCPARRLPVLNKKAVDCAIRFGLAIGAEVAQNRFSRARTTLPDLPRAYQISQFELPVVGAATMIQVGKGRQGLRKGRPSDLRPSGRTLASPCTRFHGKSGIDLNRAGQRPPGDRHRAGHAFVRTAVAYAKPCTPWCAGSASATATCRKVRSAAMPTSRCARPGHRIRHPPRNQEPQLFPLPQGSHRLRGPVADQRNRGRRKIQQATVLFDRIPAKPAPCGARKTRTTTAISPIPTCCRWSSAATGSSGSSGRAPELPGQKRERFMTVPGLSPTMTPR